MIVGKNQEALSSSNFDINKYVGFFITFGIGFLYNKDRKPERRVFYCKPQSTLIIYIVKNFVDKVISIIT